MKKLFILLSIMILSANFALASKYPKYDAEVSKIRTVKNAQTQVINTEINELSNQIEYTKSSTTLTAAQKNQKIQNYNIQIERLAAKKEQINQKYKNDKEILKMKYKH